MSENSKIFYQGWLHKQGGTVKTWKRRWCIVRGNALQYGKIQKGFFEGRGQIIFTPTTTVRSGEAVNEKIALSGAPRKYKKFGIAIETTDRTFYMVAESKDELQAWYACLQECVLAAREQQQHQHASETATILGSTTTLEFSSNNSMISSSTDSQGYSEDDLTSTTNMDDNASVASNGDQNSVVFENDDLLASPTSSSSSNYTVNSKARTKSSTSIESHLSPITKCNSPELACTTAESNFDTTTARSASASAVHSKTTLDFLNVANNAIIAKLLDKINNEIVVFSSHAEIIITTTDADAVAAAAARNRSYSVYNLKRPGSNNGREKIALVVSTHHLFILEPVSFFAQRKVPMSKVKKLNIINKKDQQQHEQQIAFVIVDDDDDSSNNDKPAGISSKQQPHTEQIIIALDNAVVDIHSGKKRHKLLIEATKLPTHVVETSSGPVTKRYAIGGENTKWQTITFTLHSDGFEGTEYDHLGIASHPKFSDFRAKLVLNGDSKIYYSGLVEKSFNIRLRDKQKRVLLITDRSIYNLSSSTTEFHASFKRRIDIPFVKSIVLEAGQTETGILIKVPSEYDLMVQSPEREEIVLTLSAASFELLNEILEVKTHNNIRNIAQLSQKSGDKKAAPVVKTKNLITETKLERALQANDSSEMESAIIEAKQNNLFADNKGLIAAVEKRKKQKELEEVISNIQFAYVERNDEWLSALLEKGNLILAAAAEESKRNAEAKAKSKHNQATRTRTTKTKTVCLPSSSTPNDKDNDNDILEQGSDDCHDIEDNEIFKNNDDDFDNVAFDESDEHADAIIFLSDLIKKMTPLLKVLKRQNVILRKIEDAFHREPRDFEAIKQGFQEGQEEGGMDEELMKLQAKLDRIEQTENTRKVVQDCIEKRDTSRLRLAMQNAQLLGVDPAELEKMRKRVNEFFEEERAKRQLLIAIDSSDLDSIEAAIKTAQPYESLRWEIENAMYEIDAIKAFAKMEEDIVEMTHEVKQMLDNGFNFEYDESDQSLTLAKLTQLIERIQQEAPANSRRNIDEQLLLRASVVVEEAMVRRMRKRLQTAMQNWDAKALEDLLSKPNSAFESLQKEIEMAQEALQMIRRHENAKKRLRDAVDSNNRQWILESIREVEALYFSQQSSTSPLSLQLLSLQEELNTAREVCELLLLKEQQMKALRHSIYEAMHNGNAAAALQAYIDHAEMLVRESQTSSSPPLTTGEQQDEEAQEHRNAEYTEEAMLRAAVAEARAYLARIEEQQQQKRETDDYQQEDYRDSASYGGSDNESDSDHDEEHDNANANDHGSDNIALNNAQEQAVRTGLRSRIPKTFTNRIQKLKEQLAQTQGLMRKKDQTPHPLIEQLRMYLLKMLQSCKNDDDDDDRDALVTVRIDKTTCRFIVDDKNLYGQNVVKTIAAIFSDQPKSVLLGRERTPWDIFKELKVPAVQRIIREFESLDEVQSLPADNFSVSASLMFIKYCLEMHHMEEIVAQLFTAKSTAHSSVYINNGDATAPPPPDEGNSSNNNNKRQRLFIRDMYKAKSLMRSATNREDLRGVLSMLKQFHFNFGFDEEEKQRRRRAEEEATIAEHTASSTTITTSSGAQIPLVRTTSDEMILEHPLVQLREGVKYIVQYFLTNSQQDPARLKLLGDDSKFPEIRSIVTKQLCQALVSFLGDGLKKKKETWNRNKGGLIISSIMTRQRSHVWHFIEAVAESKKIPQDAAGGAASLPAAVTTVNAIINRRKEMKDAFAVKFRSFICFALNYQQLANYLYLLMAIDDKIVDRFYHENALLRHEGTQNQVISMVSKLSKLSFQLSLDWETY